MINLTIDNDDSVPLPSEVPGPSRQVINLIIENNDDDDNDNGDKVIEVR